MHTKTHAHAWYRPHAEALIPRPTIYAQICIHTHTHVYKRIDVQIHTHMHTYTYILVRTHTHIHIYTHTHTKCTYQCTQARLERRRSSERVRSRCRERKFCTSLSFDAIKPHWAPPMQGLHCTHLLKHKYLSSPHPLFPIYLRTVRGLWASAVVLFYTDQMNRANSSEEAPRSFTMEWPLRSCRKIGGKAAVQQSRSTSSRKNWRLSN